jgi:hypothetical protein
VVVRDVASGLLHDLAWVPAADVEVEPVSPRSPDGLAVLRHSTAHVLAQAVQALYPGTRLGIGPPIENGFYYDFLPSRPFTPEDLGAIEKKMAEIIKSGQRFVRRPITDDEARVELADEPFKLELIDLKGSAVPDEASVEVGSDGLTMYDNLDARTGDRIWTDLCRGPHVPRTKMLRHFKLLSVAGAYWRGDSNRPMLLFAHHGDLSRWPENSLEGYVAVCDEGAVRRYGEILVIVRVESGPSRDLTEARPVGPNCEYPGGWGALLQLLTPEDDLSPVRRKPIHLVGGSTDDEGREARPIDVDYVDRMPAVRSREERDPHAVRRPIHLVETIDWRSDLANPGAVGEHDPRPRFFVARLAHCLGPVEAAFRRRQEIGQHERGRECH